MEGVAVNTALPTDANRKLYNAGSDWQKETGFYSTQYREYDPALGRFHAIDIAANYYNSWTPYQYAANNPAFFNDPKGDRVSLMRVLKERNYMVPWDRTELAKDPGGYGVYVEGGWGTRRSIEKNAEYGSPESQPVHSRGRYGYFVTTHMDWYNEEGELTDSYITGVRFEEERDDDNEEQNWWFDKQGEQLFDHWRNGKGKELILNSEEWGDYMSSNSLLERQIFLELYYNDLICRKGDGEVYGVLHGDAATGMGYATGYDLLGGSNSDVGDLIYSGNVTILQDGTYEYELEFIWNDKMDPNHQYTMDTIGASVFPGEPYIVRIKWKTKIKMKPK
jgi:RHS repeat-associated protein